MEAFVDANLDGLLQGGWQHRGGAIRVFRKSPQEMERWREKLARSETYEGWRSRNESLSAEPERNVAPVSVDPRAEAVWREVQGEIALQVPKPTYETWIRPTRGVSMDDGVFVVGAPTSFAVDWLERRQYHAVQTIVEKVMGQPLEIQFIVLGEATPWQDIEEDGEEPGVAPNSTANNESGAEVKDD